MLFTDFDSKCRKLAGISENDIEPRIRQTIINDIQMKIYGLLDGINNPFWNTTITLTVGADQEHLRDAVTNGGTITNIDASAKTITRSSGTFVVGSILDIVIVTRSSDLIAGQWKARVIAAGATATYEKIGIGTEVTFNSTVHVAFVNVMRRLSATSASISTQYVREIVKVFDDQDTGNTERVFFKKTDPREFGRLHKDFAYQKLVAWYQAGDDILLRVGANASVLGIVQAEAIIKPTLYTDDTENNEFTIPPEHNQILTDEVVAEYIKNQGNPVPQDIAGRLALYQAQYQAAAANRAKALEAKSQANQ